MTLQFGGSDYKHVCDRKCSHVPRITSSGWLHQTADVAITAPATGALMQSPSHAKYDPKRRMQNSDLESITIDGYIDAAACKQLLLPHFAGSGRSELHSGKRLMAPLPVLALAAAGMLAPAVCQRGRSRGCSGLRCGGVTASHRQLAGADTAAAETIVVDWAATGAVTVVACCWRRQLEVAGTGSTARPPHVSLTAAGVGCRLMLSVLPLSVPTFGAASAS